MSTSQRNRRPGDKTEAAERKADDLGRSGGMYSSGHGKATPEEIRRAATWLLENPDAMRPLLPKLRSEFGLSAATAIDVIRFATKLRGARK